MRNCRAPAPCDASAKPALQPETSPGAPMSSSPDLGSLRCHNQQDHHAGEGCKMSARKEMKSTLHPSLASVWGEGNGNVLKITRGSSDCISWSAENELMWTVMLLSLFGRTASSCKHPSCWEVVSHV